MGQTLNALKHYTGSETLISPGEIVELRFSSPQALSLRASKIMHALVDAAGADVCDDVVHQARFADIRHTDMRISEIYSCLRELGQALVSVTYYEGDRKRERTTPLIFEVDRPEDEFPDGAEIRWQFPPTIRAIFESSNHWAALSRAAVLAFESRYSLRLYELLTLRGGLRHKREETFELGDLRRRLGVPVGKLKTWTHLRQFALDPAFNEVNQLSGITASYEPIKRGRRVAQVRIEWIMQDDSQARIGQDTAKTDKDAPPAPPHTPQPASEAQDGVDGFPRQGGLKFGQHRRVWLELARDHAKPLPDGNKPDPDMIADSFRGWCQWKGIPLNSKGIEATFIGFCASYAP